MSNKVAFVATIIGVTIVALVMLMLATCATASATIEMKATTLNTDFLQSSGQGKWLQNPSNPNQLILSYNSACVSNFDVASRTLVCFGNLAGVQVNEVTKRPVGQEDLNGQCVSFVKAVTHVTQYSTSSWTRSRQVIGNNIPVGTAIASFGSSTTFASGKMHVAIYAGPVYSGSKIIGINVWDQNFIGYPTYRLVGYHSLVSSSSLMSDAYIVTPVIVAIKYTLISLSSCIIWPRDYSYYVVNIPG